MQLSDIPSQPSARVLRQFAGLFVLVFGSLACREAFFRDRPLVAGGLAVASALVGTIGLAAPKLLRPLFVGWMIVVFPLGWIVARLMLAILFFGLFTPLAFVLRLAGRDPLALRSGPRRYTDTYWERRLERRDARAYFRQF